MEDQKADPVIKHIWTIRYGLITTILIAVFTFATIFISLTLFLTMCIIPIFVALIIVRLIAALAYRNYSYSILEDYILIKRGILSRHSVRLTFERVQNVNIVKKILDRIFGVGTVQIETAGGSGVGGAGGSSEGYILALRHPKPMAEFILDRAQGTSHIHGVHDDGLHSSTRARARSVAASADASTGSGDRSSMQDAILEQLENISYQLEVIKRQL